jgi:hypothetical protein
MYLLPLFVSIIAAGGTVCTLHKYTEEFHTEEFHTEDFRNNTKLSQVEVPLLCCEKPEWNNSCADSSLWATGPKFHNQNTSRMHTHMKKKQSLFDFFIMYCSLTLLCTIAVFLLVQ